LRNVSREERLRFAGIQTPFTDSAEHPGGGDSLMSAVDSRRSVRVGRTIDPRRSLVSSRSRRSSVVLLAMLAAATVATAQSKESPSFEVASIRPSADTPPATGAAGVQITKERVHFGYLSLRDYLSIAYGVPVQRITAPDWIATARFDISATFPGGATPEQFPLLVQNLLRDRFRLQAHLEKRESPVYALEVAPGGLRATRIPDDAPTDAPLTITGSGSRDGVTADLGQGASLEFKNDKFEARRVTMRILAETLGRFVDRPIVDLTNLDGRYDIKFAVAQEDYMPMLVRSAVNAGITLPPQAMAALDLPSMGSVENGLKSLGLVITPRRSPLDVLVVDSIEKAPTEN